MKDCIFKLVAVIVTMFAGFVVAIPMTSTLAVLIAYVIVEHLVNHAYSHIKEKVFPNVYEWVEYGCQTVAFILLVAGFYYNSLYTIIFGIVFLVASIISVLIKNKKI